MSLNAKEIRRTSEELTWNAELSGLTREQMAADLELDPERLVESFSVDADPVDVWLLRDYLDLACRDAGRMPAWSVLTDASRRKATTWFALREAPRHAPADA